MALSVVPSLELSIHSTEARQYLSPGAVFLSGAILAAMSAGFGSLKGYLSTQYADSQTQKDASKNGLPPAAALLPLIFFGVCLHYLT